MNLSTQESTMSICRQSSVRKAFSRRSCQAALIALLAAGPALAQSNATPATAPDAGKAAASAPAPLVVHFDVGSSSIRAEDLVVLDKASRAYSEGKPLVMILTGTADSTGAANVNLLLSQQRATAVLNAL